MLKLSGVNYFIIHVNLISVTKANDSYFKILIIYLRAGMQTENSGGQALFQPYISFYIIRSDTYSFSVSLKGYFNFHKITASLVTRRRILY